MTIAYYTFLSGLPGCMPDYNSGAYRFDTRKDLANTVRSELQMLDYPAHLFQEVQIRELWGLIKRRGSSAAHVTIYHGDRIFEMCGLTKDEYNMDQEINQ